jgi:two-component system chemotaxis response regulator CheY
MKRVLVVDDAATVRMYHKNILTEAGFMVEEAANGLEAYEKALLEPYDLYVVDINMPQMDGYTFVRQLRANSEINQSPVIMVSTESQPKDIEQAIDAGANFYIIKPVKPHELKRYCSMLTGRAYE